MASPQSYAIRSVQARERIFAVLREIFPEAEMPTIPTTSKYGALHLQAAQWEALADGVEQMAGFSEPLDEGTEEPMETEYDSMSRGDLEKMVSERQLDMYIEPTGTNGRPVKADFLKVLTDADSGKFETGSTGNVDLGDESDMSGVDAEGDAFGSEGTFGDGANS